MHGKQREIQESHTQNHIYFWKRCSGSKEQRDLPFANLLFSKLGSGYGYSFYALQILYILNAALFLKRVSLIWYISSTISTIPTFYMIGKVQITAKYLWE